MILNAASVCLATSAAIAIIVAMATVSPASAQTTTYPAGTDCTKLVGNSKTECANQAKMTGAPDNSNNPSNPTMNNNTGTDASGASGTGTQMPTSNATKDYHGKDCTALVGNDKTECAAQNKQSGSPDNSNNPSQSEPAQSN